MNKWASKQKEKIWRLYTLEMLTCAQIAERYADIGATRESIAGLLYRIHKQRDQELNKQIKNPKKKSNKK